MKNLIKPAELLENYDNYTIIDCRDDSDFRGCGLKAYKEGHLPKAQVIDVDWLLKPAGVHGGVSPLPKMEDFAKIMEGLGIGNEKPVVIYGHNNDLSFAARLWWMLKYIGLEDVKLLLGGFVKWQELGHPVNTEDEPKNERGTIEINIQEDMLVGIEDVYEAIEKESFTIMDARPEALFKGEGMEEWTGHLQGSINIPYCEFFDGELNLLEDKVKEAAERVKAMQRPTIAYCYSGLTAQYLSLLLNEYGIYPRVYVGSVSDWISYEDNSLLRG